MKPRLSRAAAPPCSTPSAARSTNWANACRSLPESDRPGAVIVAILTDGLENASTHFKWRDIAEKIRHQRDSYQWEFLFLGANQDAIATAAQLNIGRHYSASIDSSDIDSASHAIMRVTTAGRHVRSGCAGPQHIKDLSSPLQDIADDEAKKKKKKSSGSKSPK